MWHVVCEYVCKCVCGGGGDYVQIILCITLTNIISLNNLLLDVNFDKFIIKLHYIHILPMLKISRLSNINSPVINNYLN